MKKFLKNSCYTIGHFATITACLGRQVNAAPILTNESIIGIEIKIGTNDDAGNTLAAS